LAPIGDFPAAGSKALVDHYHEKFGLNVQLLPAMPIPPAAFDSARRQVIAERLVEAISTPKEVATDRAAVVIGLTTVDMYIAAKSWTYAYSLRADGRFAVISSARMDAFGADEARQAQRLRKMVTKDIGVLFFGLPLNDDPGSVLYRRIDGPLDLDHVSEDF
jgi:predicted Zn-dependent protease